MEDTSQKLAKTYNVKVSILKQDAKDFKYKVRYTHPAANDTPKLRN